MDEHNENIRGSDTFRNTVKPSPPGEVKPSSTDDALLGQLLGGRYLVARKLGAGGFGSVYLAIDEKVTSRNVVIKVLHKEEIANEGSVKRFQKEIEALARVDHPAIVGIYDVGETNDATPYIVMQYVDGQNLRAAIEAGAMDQQRIANIVRQIGRALSAAHEKGILHRDLKPENVMLQKLTGEAEQVKIIDFGIAKVKNSKVALSTATDQAVGTIAYMAPEQLRAESLTFACDVYAMAVISYEMLTGQRPLNPSSSYQLLDLQREGVKVKPSELRHDVSRLVDRAVLKALSFEPEDRYASAREFGDLLADALSGVGEETLIRSPDTQAAPIFEEGKDDVPVTANVLFMDIVGYSKLLMDMQTSSLRRLQETVLNTDECRIAYDSRNCIRLPTGDGMALVFFGEPEMALRSALQITEALKSYPDVELRMGVHSGLIYRMADINTNLNVAGGAINMAQRVMDCGDTGHILVSKRVADDLAQLSRWAGYLHDLGEVEVKHGVRIHVFNVYGDGFGNPAIPVKLAKSKPKLNYRVALAVGAVVIFVLALGVWYATRSRAIEPARLPGVSVAAVPAEPQQSLTYWLDVQKKIGDHFGPVFQSSGSEVFGNGWRFKFNVQPAKDGAFYLLSEGAGENGETVYDILFPTPGQGGKATLQSKQSWQTPWNRFVESTGVEKLWIVWSAKPLAELDSVFSDASKSAGRINSNGVEKLKKYLQQYETKPPKVVSMKEKEMTVISGDGDLLVSRIELTHKAY